MGSLLRKINLVLLLLVSPALGQGNGDRTHGTVNVVLGNAHGVIVLTDSRLSSDGQERGESAKLFKLDPRTVCAIAGFYADPGPSTGRALPAATTIPWLFARYSAHNLGNATLEQKLDTLIEIFTFNLGFVAAARGADHESSQLPSRSELSVVGLEGDHLEVLTAELAPHIANSFIRYVVESRSRSVVGTHLVTRFAGMTDVADWDMAHLRELALSKDPILQFFGEEELKDEGASLDVKTLLQVARKIALDTSRKHPIEVGGPLQFATLSKNGIDDFESKPVDQVAFENLRLRIDRLTVSSSGQAIAIPPPVIVLLDQAKITTTKQHLDGLMIVNSTFSHCHLYYNGDPRTYFASDNVLSDTDLTIGPEVSDQSPFLVGLRASFPSLQIRHAFDSASFEAP